MPAPRIALPKSAGRYDGNPSNTRAVPGGRAQVNARLRTVDAVPAAVDDPFGGKERIVVTVNRRTDILEVERSHGRISEAAYRTGQILQAVFERFGYAGVGSASLDGAGTADPVKAIGDKTVRMLETAHQVRSMMDGVSRQLGMIDTRLLRRILGDRMSFAQCAAFEGKGGERGTGYVATRFRDALEELARVWAAKGTGPARESDRYDLAAEARQPVDPSGES